MKNGLPHAVGDGFEYFLNGFLHRIDGPAVDLPRRKRYFFLGIELSKKQLERLVSIKTIKINGIKLICTKEILIKKDFNHITTIINDLVYISRDNELLSLINNSKIIEPILDYVTEKFLTSSYH
jgi:hypothetical protein